MQSNTVRGVHSVITTGFEQKIVTELLLLVMAFCYSNSYEEETMLNDCNAL